MREAIFAAAAMGQNIKRIRAFLRVRDGGRFEAKHTQRPRDAGVPIS